MYAPDPKRYDSPDFYRRCGRSGLLLPQISLGLWHNFGNAADDDNCRQMIYTAFDHGITHFDIANNYGPAPGSAEMRFGRILPDLPRDEVIVSTKAGYLMWPGPYGEWGSRKHLLASLDQSLQRLGIDYVDIFYHHRPDPDTPVEESMEAIDQAVRSGKAIYAGISSYRGDATCAAVAAAPTRPIIHQPNYSMFDRWIEDDLLPVTDELGVGVIAFCPLAQGLLTNRYLDGIPADSRAGRDGTFLQPDRVTEPVVRTARRLNDIAQQRGQSLAQMALQWVLRDARVTSALIGASRPEQIVENVAATTQADLTTDEQKQIDDILAG